MRFDRDGFGRLVSMLRWRAVSSSCASQELGVPRRTVQRWLRRLVSEGRALRYEWWVQSGRRCVWLRRGVTWKGCDR